MEPTTFLRLSRSDRLLAALVAVIGVCTALSGGREEPVQVQNEPATPTAVAPLPTVTPSCPTPAEQSFFNKARVNTDYYKDQFLAAAEVLERTESNPLLIYDETWRWELLSWYQAAIMFAEDVADYPSAPPSTYEIRQDMSQLASLAREIEELFVQIFLAVDADQLLDPREIAAVKPKMDLITTILLVHQFDWRYIERFCEKRQ